ncbi:ubiquitin-like-conjugating enzyme ATG10 [Halyomorpha halys]|uniref:ubiquitin-like-conjugating enzyme ATG10 n=1 Tax=Halyomorpha halys TaxID=286706 RepID=UPI0034D1E236
MGRLSWKRFIEDAKRFVEISNKINDGWEIKEIEHLSNPGKQYLCKRELRNNNSETYMWEYHILYSVSYEVPVLYFKVTSTEGQMVNFQKVSDIIYDGLPEILKKNITQCEHPLIKRPYYFLHPCKTSDLLWNDDVHKNVPYRPLPPNGINKIEGVLFNAQPKRAIQLMHRIKELIYITPHCLLFTLLSS